MELFMDKNAPKVWRDAQALSASVRTYAAAGGLSEQESELIKVHASQLNGCLFCLDLHAREARAAGVAQQKLDLLPAWREGKLFNDREQAVLAIAEAATLLPLSEGSRADLFGARTVLGDQTFLAAQWVATTINLFNRISILSEHPVRPRDNEGRTIR